MSLGPYNTLMMMKGWEWLPHLTYTDTVKRGSVIEHEFVGTGWLMGIIFASSDCRAGFEVWTRTGRQALKKIFDITVEDSEGSYQVDPNGYAPIYLRPNKDHTAGVYIMSAFNGWGYGSYLPFLDRTRIRIKLGSESDQEEAATYWFGGIMSIINVKTFIKSFREFNGTRNMLIDDELVEFGNQESK